MATSRHSSFVVLLKAATVLLAVALAVTGLGFNLFFQPRWGPEPPGDFGLLADIRSRIQTDSLGKTISLPGVTSFEWSRLCVLSGYATRSRAERLLGQEWRYRWINPTNETESRAVFLLGEKVVATAKNGAFHGISPQCYGPDEATFGVGRGRSGTFWLYKLRRTPEYEGP